MLNGLDRLFEFSNSKYEYEIKEVVCFIKFMICNACRHEN